MHWNHFLAHTKRFSCAFYIRIVFSIQHVVDPVPDPTKTSMDSENP